MFAFIMSIVSTTILAFSNILSPISSNAHNYNSQSHTF